MISARVKRRVLGGIGLALSVLIIGMVFYAVPLREVTAALRRVEVWPFLAAMGVAAIGILLRGARWSLLFRPHFDVPVRRASNYAMLGLAVNAILPARPGDVVRLGLVARRFKTGVVFTGATLVAERMLDGVTLLIFLGSSVALITGLDGQVAAGLLGYEVSGEAVMATAKLILAVTVSILVAIGILLLPAGRELVRRMVRRLPLSARLRGILESRLIAELEKGLSALGHAAVLLKVSLYSIAIWGSLALCNFAAAAGMPGIELSLGQALVLTSISVAASSMPSAPGAWGMFEAGALLALALLGLEVADGVAVAFVFVAHAAQYIPVIVLGLFAAWRERGAIGHIRDINP